MDGLFSKGHILHLNLFEFRVIFERGTDNLGRERSKSILELRLNHSRLLIFALQEMNQVLKCSMQYHISQASISEEFFGRVIFSSAIYFHMMITKHLFIHLLFYNLNSIFHENIQRSYGIEIEIVSVFYEIESSATPSSLLLLLPSYYFIINPSFLPYFFAHSAKTNTKTFMFTNL